PGRRVDGRRTDGGRHHRRGYRSDGLLRGLAERQLGRGEARTWGSDPRQPDARPRLHDSAVETLPSREADGNGGGACAASARCTEKEGFEPSMETFIPI